MPTAEINGFQMYYEDHAPEKEEAFLLIMGFTANATVWAAHIPFLAQRYRVVAFDNRGSGRSESPVMNTYTIPMMADDAVALLDHLGIDRAHVYGASMGGMIAQELALRQPNRVHSLILGCTTPGGQSAIAADPEDSLQFLKLITMTVEEQAEFSLPILFSQPFIDANRELLVEQALMNPELAAKPAGIMRQFAGCMQHDTYDRLGQISAPTLVLTGTGDRIIDARNSKLIADAIPGAELVEYPGAGHGYFGECLLEDIQNVMAFAERHSPVPA